MDILASTLDTVGTLLIAWAALSVHHKVLNEHKIDNAVYRKMKKEQFLGFLGIALVVIGYLLDVSYHTL